MILFVGSGALKAWTPTTPQVAVAAIGGTGEDVASAVTTDASGNIFTVGTFSSTVDFDPGVGVSTLSSNGGLDIFVSKMDSTGDLVWVISFGGTEVDAGTAISLDVTGNVYVGGAFSSTVDFDPGNGVSNVASLGGEDAFVAKFDSLGGLVWVKTVGGVGTGGDRVRSIAIDGAQNVVSTGSFVSTADFDPGVGTANLTASSTDAFLWKLDSAGNYVWAKKIAGTNVERGHSVSIDSTGNILVGGSFYSTVDFDPGVGNFPLVAQIQDAFLAKYDSLGDFVWARQLGAASSSTQGIMLAVDTSDNVLLVGSFQNTVDFEPGAGTTNITSTGGFDAYVWKLNSSGALVWGRKFGGASPDIANAVTVDSSGNAYIAGYFQGTADFDPGVGVLSATSAGSYDAYAWKLDTSGALVWGRQLGGTSSDSANAIKVDASNNAVVAGYFQATADFDPEMGTANVTSLGGSDAYVWKLDNTGLPVAPTSSTTSSSTSSTSAPTTSLALSSTTSSIAPSTNIASLDSSTTTSVTTTTTTVNSAVNAVVSSTTVVTSKVSKSADLPTTGSSQTSLIMWAILILLMGIGLRLRN